MTAGDETAAIIVFAHGSRVEDANGGVRELARQVQQAGGFHYVRAAFLEMAQPDLATAIAEAVSAGQRRVIIIPYFLTMGVHLRRDLPELIARERGRYPGVEIHASEPLEGHPQLSSIILERIREVEAGHKPYRPAPCWPAS
jgi:sirohydrochlorin ferrochelatase